MRTFLETREFLVELFKFLPNWFTKYEINGISNKGDQEKFHDWGITQLDSILPLKDKTIIEMGSQEAAHTIMMHELGAHKIIGLEGRLSNYIKCCVIKNIYELVNAKFYFEDLRYVDLKKFGTFDVCVCSGLLYHLPNPQDLIKKISEISTRILINSHYANADFPSTGLASVVLDGKQYSGKTYDEVDSSHPNSGLQQFSFWFLKDDFIRVLHDVGYDNVRVLKDWGLDTPKPKMAAITIYAEKTRT